MAIVVKISTVDKSSLIAPTSVAWSRRLNGSGDASFLINSTSFRPIEGEPVEIWEDGVIAFGGLIARIAEVATFDSGTTDFQVRVSCSTWDAILMQRFAVEVYTSTTTNAIVADLRTKYLNADGITAGTISAGVAIDRYNIDHSSGSLYEIFQDLAKLDDFCCFVDASKALQYRAPEVATASWTVVDAASHVTNLEVERSAVPDSYANKIYRIVAPEALAAVVETFSMTGSPTVWDLADYARTVERIRADVGSGFEERTFGLGGVETDRDYYWNVGSSAISQDVANTETGTLEVTYRAFGANVVTSTDASGIAARAAIEGTSGKHERVVDDSSNVDAALAQDANDAELALFSAIPILLRAVTVDTKPRPGHVITFTMTTPAVSGDFIVQEIQATGLEDGGFLYTYTATNVSRVPGWQEWLKAIKGKGRSRGTGIGGSTVVATELVIAHA